MNKKNKGFVIIDSVTSIIIMAILVYLGYLNVKLGLLSLFILGAFLIISLENKKIDREKIVESEQ